MKKYKWLIVIALLMLALFIVAIVFSEDEGKFLKEISVSDAIDMKNDKKSFILYIKQTNCEHCKAFSPKFISALKSSKLKAYTINVEELSSDDEKLYNDNFSIDGTPTVLFFDNGSESMIRIEGELPKDKVISKFEAAGFIKK